ncbi:MAG: hypothetical protein JWM68_92 [Verrucomicrobiales bacterium]|nr:hypothetical protein [Verrucomicrobiales bacterium]
MNTDSKQFLLLVAALSMVTFGQAAEPKALYANTFDMVTVGPLPEEFLVIDGAFAVKEDGGNKFIELPGAPLDTFRLLYGPTTNFNVAASAKILGTAKGRRFPTFAVGLNGVGGYRLQVSPAKKMLELYKGDDLLKGVAYEWKSGEWTQLRLEMKKAGEGKFVLQGTASAKSETEPKEPQLTFEANATPSNGRPSVWGSPYSGTPIWFDDLSLSVSK